MPNVLFGKAEKVSVCVNQNAVETTKSDFVFRMLLISSVLSGFTENICIETRPGLEVTITSHADKLCHGVEWSFKMLRHIYSHISHIFIYWTIDTMLLSSCSFCFFVIKIYLAVTSPKCTLSQACTALLRHSLGQGTQGSRGSGVQDSKIMKLRYLGVYQPQMGFSEIGRSKKSKVGQ